MKKNIFIRLIACVVLFSPITTIFSLPHHHAKHWRKPRRLKMGDTVALVSSASRTVPLTKQLLFAKERLEALGLNVIVGKSVFQKNGYFAGTDQARAADLNTMFANHKVKAIFEMRGGWGCARILPYLNYELIKKNPKIFIGFSDITALEIAMAKYSNLISYYGPMAELPWPNFTVEQMKKIIFDGTSPVTLQNPVDEVDPKKDIIQSEDRIETLIPGTAKGVLMGGNLSIIVSLLGTPYEPDWTGKILFVEDVAEYHYRIDRMMAQLQQAGVLKKIRGFVFGTCMDCEVSVDTVKHTNASFSIDEILLHYLKPYHIPAFMGSMIGHDPKIFTVPQGVHAEINANKGTIRLLEASVKP